MLMWCGEEGVRVYGVGLGETRSSRNFLRQVRLYSDPELRLQVVRRMYEYRFPGEDLTGLRLEEIRGREGVRVREAYARASRETGVDWKGREYKSSNWRSADPINRALSAGTSCLYGLCHAAIVASGYSPALGFVHTGKALSFVYDIADLYKATIVVPTAFRVAQDGNSAVETHMRHLLRDTFLESRLLEKIVPDLALLTRGATETKEQEEDFDADDAMPSGLWDPEAGTIAGGINYSDTEV
jgi:CRISP-associated protein Cas1